MTLPDSKWVLRTRLLSRVNKLRTCIVASVLVMLCLSHSACFGDDAPSTYYGKVVVPRTNEFRWSDGGLPQTFDPAFAAAPPDTDAIRALFEGLTEYDPQTLTPLPAVATRWESSNENKVWTFYLRENARWSNGDKVTASDFVRSWQRTLKIGPLAPHTDLLSNIEGAVRQPPPTTPHDATKPADPVPAFGATAIGDHVLRVNLLAPDSSFPALVAHPVFRPVKVSEPDKIQRLEAHELISNGAFQLSTNDTQKVSLERAHNYWDGASVGLERLTFVTTETPEAALAAYQAGEIDAVTNAPFQPLALKLLTPYKDFRRTTFGALTYYSFNTSREPFDDVRVREALALAIDRERISKDDLGGATEPAGKFLPQQMSGGSKPVVEKTELLEEDLNRARQLLVEAGYADGEEFPVVRLLINRNEQQRLVAESIAAMWRSALNIETEIIVKNWDEYEAMIKSGEYHVVRRGIVMQTTDELTNLRLLFGRDFQLTQPNSPAAAESTGSVPGATPEIKTSEVVDSETQALKELRAVPIYFASSYSLVKPYVLGFDSNVLDVSSPKRIRVDLNWVAPKTR
jgi:oligopeptide transport system substrate-binding protein